MCEEEEGKADSWDMVLDDEATIHIDPHGGFDFGNVRSDKIGKLLAYRRNVLGIKTGRSTGENYGLPPIQQTLNAVRTVGGGTKRTTVEFGGSGFPLPIYGSSDAHKIHMKESQARLENMNRWILLVDSSKSIQRNISSLGKRYQDGIDRFEKERDVAIEEATAHRRKWYAECLIMKVGGYWEERPAVEWENHLDKLKKERDRCILDDIISKFGYPEESLLRMAKLRDDELKLYEEQLSKERSEGIPIVLRHTIRDSVTIDIVLQYITA